MNRRQFVTKTKNVVVNNRTLPFFSMLTLILITLKLTGTITIGWGWIVACFFAPLIILLSFLGIIFGGFLIFIIGGGICIAIMHAYEQIKKKAWR